MSEYENSNHEHVNSENPNKKDSENEPLLKHSSIEEKESSPLMKFFQDVVDKVKSVFAESTFISNVKAFFQKITDVFRPDNNSEKKTSQTLMGNTNPPKKEPKEKISDRASITRSLIDKAESITSRNSQRPVNERSNTLVEEKKSSNAPR